MESNHTTTVKHETFYESVDTDYLPTGGAYESVSPFWTRTFHTQEIILTRKVQ